jgi:phage replication O-like protein O
MKQRLPAEASPFDGVEPPNHTQIPNALLDDLMRLMDCAELKVTLAICRQTFGWHKKEDELSLSQLKAMTGLSRQSVITGIEAGMQRGVIRRRPKGQSYVYRIQLVQKLDQLGAIDGTEPPKPPQLVQKLDQSAPAASPKIRHTKERKESWWW